MIKAPKEGVEVFPATPHLEFNNPPTGPFESHVQL